MAHEILNGFTGPRSYNNQPTVYDGMDQGESHPRCFHRAFSQAILQANVNEKPAPPDGWSTCAKTVQKYDENIVRNWKEEIDTLLVFVRIIKVYIPEIDLTS